jgi:hypothetical protein
MIVNYIPPSTKVRDEVVNVINTARREGRKINSIDLTPAEWQEFKNVVDVTIYTNHCTYFGTYINMVEVENDN